MERKEKNLIESERLYKIVLTSEPDHPVALMGYALLCHDLKRTDQARGYLQKLHQGHPQDLIILLVRRWILNLLFTSLTIHLNTTIYDTVDLGYF